MNSADMQRYVRIRMRWTWTGATGAVRERCRDDRIIRQCYRQKDLQAYLTLIGFQQHKWYIWTYSGGSSCLQLVVADVLKAAGMVLWEGIQIWRRCRVCLMIQNGEEDVNYRNCPTIKENLQMKLHIWGRYVLVGDFVIRFQDMPAFADVENRNSLIETCRKHCM